MGFCSSSPVLQKSCGPLASPPPQLHSGKTGHHPLSDLRPAPTSRSLCPEPGGAPRFSGPGFQEPPAPPAPCASREMLAHALSGSLGQSSLSASWSSALKLIYTTAADVSKSLTLDEDALLPGRDSWQLPQKQCGPPHEASCCFPGPGTVQVGSSATWLAASPSDPFSYGPSLSSRCAQKRRSRRLKPSSSMQAASAVHWKEESFRGGFTSLRDLQPHTYDLSSHTHFSITQ